jgi:mycoredoxin
MSEKQTIIVYGTRWCPDCHRAQRIFRARNVVFDYVDIGRCARSRAYVEQINNGNRSVPTIIFPDGDILVEPSNRALNAKLDSISIPALGED